MDSLKQKAIEQSLLDLRDKNNLIGKITKLATANEVLVTIIIPVEYQTNELIRLLFNTRRADFNEGSRSRKAYACFTNLGSSFFTPEQTIELAMAKEVFEALGGIYFDTLEGLYEFLLNKLGDEDADSNL